MQALLPLDLRTFRRKPTKQPPTHPTGQGDLTFTRKVWDTHTGDCLHTLQHSHIVRAVAFPSTPRPEVIATGGFEKKLRIFDLNRSSSSSRSASPTSPVASNGNTTSNISAPTPGHEIGPGVHTGIIKSIAWGSDPAILITACDDKKIRWWDLRVRSPITSYDLDGGLGTCELNDFALSVAAGKTAYFFSPTVPGQLLRDPVKTPYEIASVAVHGEKRKFVTGGSINNTWVRVYDLDTEQELDTNKGHHGPIWSVAFSPDGKLYATGSEDGTIKLWKFVEGPFGLWK